VEGLNSINSCALPGKLKLWCFQFGPLPMLQWSLTVYKVSLTTVDKLEALISLYIRKWLEVPRCLSRVGLNGKGILQPSFSEPSLHNECVREAAPVLKTGRKWSTRKSVIEAKAALQIGDIVGLVQHGRGGFG